MEPVNLLVVILLIAATVMCGLVSWAAFELARTARRLNDSTAETTQRLVPLLEKSDVTVDAINAELLRIDAIITQFEDASARVSHASDTITGLVVNPGEAVSGMAGRVRRAWRERRRAPEHEEEPAVNSQDSVEE